MSIIEDPEIVREFIAESNDHLEDVESKILLLEEKPDDLELINGIFRPIHSMKGSAGFLGLNEIASFSHELETLLDNARKGKTKITPDIISLLLESKDMLRKLIGNLSKEMEKPKGNVGETLSNATGISDGVKALMQRVSVLLMNNPSEECHGQTRPVHWTGDPAVPPCERSVKGESKNISQSEKATPKLLGEILVDAGAVTQEQLEAALELQDKKVGEILVERGATTPDKVDEALKKQEIFDKSSSATVKVHINKLDNLVNLVGELVISQALINEEVSLINGNGISKNLSHLGKITKEIQDQVMSLRMVPLKPVFQKMSRLVRDLSAKAGKKIQLEISGEDTELDKSVIEQIGDPLVHLIRNSVDHGIEPAAERIAMGKPEIGTIQLNAFYKGGNIIIEISDDGRGLAKGKILKKAVEKGIIEEHAVLADNQIYNLIFLPGFSTAEKVTDVSGRGVGMDVVKKNIEKLRGKIDIYTKEGSVTRFSIKLPLTLAIIDGMIVEVGNERFIIPILSIEESIRPRREEISTVQNRGEIANVRGNLLPIVRLHKVYKIQPKKVDPRDALLVIVE
ncbi:MAG TPA: chemotaxis protein CheA, partial [Candidatus Brocadiales bacterium]|nr:chemotaxis protein CheA [Candidatus Brocadiales bacterium]